MEFVRRRLAADGAGMNPAPRVGALKPVFAARPPAKIRIGLNAFSFDAALRLNLREPGAGVGLMELLDFCADRGFETIDPTGYYFPGYPEAPDAEFVAAFKRRAFALGLTISGTGVKNNFAHPDPAVRAADVRRVMTWIEVAARLGAPVLRVFSGEVPPAPHTWAEAADWVTDCLRPCVEHARKHGVILGLQNHGDLLRTADECIALLSRFDPAVLGLVLDTGYFLTPDPYVDIARMIPYAVNWQIKERTHGGAGPATDLPRLVRLIREAGYRGNVPIETLSIRGVPYDPVVAVDTLLADLRAALGES